MCVQQTYRGSDDRVGRAFGQAGKQPSLSVGVACVRSGRVEPEQHCCPGPPRRRGQRGKAIGCLSIQEREREVAGWRVIYEERARAWTEAPSTLGQLRKQRYRWCYGTLPAIWKHRGAVLRRGQADGSSGARMFPSAARLISLLQVGPCRHLRRGHVRRDTPLHSATAFRCRFKCYSVAMGPTRVSPLRRQQGSIDDWAFGNSAQPSRTLGQVCAGTERIIRGRGCAVQCESTR